MGLTYNFLVLGIAIVVSMLVAVVIKVIVGLLGRQLPLPHTVTAGVGTVAPGAATGGPADPSADPDEPPAHHVAAIAAAVASVMDSPQIVHIEPVRGVGWTAEGRQAHRGSHQTGHGRPAR